MAGGLAGLTLGASSALAAPALGEIVVASATSNVIGGAVTRSLDPAVQADSSAGQELTAIGTDVAFGAAGGAVGAGAGAATRSSLPQVQKQIQASLPAARRGNFGASQSVKGHTVKAAAIEQSARTRDVVGAAVTTNQFLPVIKETALPARRAREEEEKERR